MRAGAAGVVIAGRRKEKLAEVAASLDKVNRGSTTILTVAADVKAEGDVVHLFEQVIKTFSRPADVVIANAGTGSDLLPLGEQTVPDWWNTLVGGFRSRVRGD